MSANRSTISQIINLARHFADFLVSAAVAEFKGPKIFGVVRLAQVSMELARIEANFSGLSPGKHGWSINEFGDLTRGAASTGKAFNPSNEGTDKEVFFQLLPSLDFIFPFFYINHQVSSHALPFPVISPSLSLSAYASVISFSNHQIASMRLKSTAYLLKIVLTGQWICQCYLKGKNKKKGIVLPQHYFLLQTCVVINFLIS